MSTKHQHFSVSERDSFAEIRARLWQIAVWSIVVCLLGCGVLLSIGAPVHLQGRVEAWATLTVAIVFQAAPFLVLGVTLSAGIALFVPETAFLRLRRLPRVALIPGLAGAGALVPGCECSSVPVAKSLINRGVPPAAALSFMLASPTINPIVLVATAVAFPAAPQMVWARLGAGLFAACLVGALWQLLSHTSRGQSAKHGLQDKHSGHQPADCHHHGNEAGGRWRGFCEHVTREFASAGGFLVIGAMIAALLKVVIPASVTQAMENNLVLACIFMAALAIVMSVCSEADAFIAASFSMISPVALLVFLVVGPMVDLKLIAMHYGAWGARFVAVFAPLTVVCALLSAVMVGTVLL